MHCFSFLSGRQASFLIKGMIFAWSELLAWSELRRLRRTRRTWLPRFALSGSAAPGLFKHQFVGMKKCVGGNCVGQRYADRGAAFRAVNKHGIKLRTYKFEFIMPAVRTFAGYVAFIFKFTQHKMND